jgi:hypothetical protein
MKNGCLETHHGDLRCNHPRQSESNGLSSVPYGLSAPHTTTTRQGKPPRNGVVSGKEGAVREGALTKTPALDLESQPRSPSARVPLLTPGSPSILPLGDSEHIAGRCRAMTLSDLTARGRERTGWGQVQSLGQKAYEAQLLATLHKHQIFDFGQISDFERVTVAILNNFRSTYFPF